MSKADAANARLNAFIDANSGLYGKAIPYEFRDYDYTPAVIKEREFWEFEITFYTESDYKTKTDQTIYRIPKSKLEKGDLDAANAMIKKKFEGYHYTGKAINGFN